MLQKIGWEENKSVNFLCWQKLCYKKLARQKKSVNVYIEKSTEMNLCYKELVEKKNKV